MHEACVLSLGADLGGVKLVQSVETVLFPILFPQCRP